MLFTRVDLDIKALPYNGQVLRLLQQLKEKGNVIYLVTATDERIARLISVHLAGIFDGYYASDGVLNLRKHAKAKLLINLFGERKFTYFGNSRDDLPVWRHAREAVVVSSSPRLIRRARKIANVSRVL